MNIVSLVGEMKVSYLRVIFRVVFMKYVPERVPVKGKGKTISVTGRGGPYRY
jgi:hypothetical protein